MVRSEGVVSGREGGVSVMRSEDVVRENDQTEEEVRRNGVDHG